MNDNEMDVDPTTTNEETWKGNSIEQINRGLDRWLFKAVSSVQPSDNHTVLYNLPLQPSTKPPKPYRGSNKWDSDHVRLPSSSKNQYPVVMDDGTDDIQNRWELIREAFSKPIQSSRELEAAILSYNTKYSKIWKFRALHKLFEEECTEEYSFDFFSQVLPGIIELALRLPELICTAIPLLKQTQNRSVSFSQEQIASLLANAFLCTFPRRNTTKTHSEYRTFPDINFNRLYSHPDEYVLEKIKCICNYFRRVCIKMPVGVVTIVRRYIPDSDIPNWNGCVARFKNSRLHITSEGTIEDQGNGYLQVDFANRFLGGGVLGLGCVQEEIRFVLCPEMFISRLITESMLSNEAVFLIGCERYNNYTGYASSFKYSGNIEDETPMDDSRRRQCCIVAIDALRFQKPIDQFCEDRMNRELRKAYVGYYNSLKTPAPAVATGNWGCGAFGGDKRLKALLQLMVCCATSRPLVYFTFGDDELRDDFHEMFNFLVSEDLTVAKIWSYLKEFCHNDLKPHQLYGFIYQLHFDKTKIPKSISSKEPPKYNPLFVPKLQRLGFSPDLFYGKNATFDDDEIETVVKRAKNLNTKTNERPSTSTSHSSLLDLLDQSFYEQASNRETINDQPEPNQISGFNCPDEVQQNEKSNTEATSNANVTNENDEQNLKEIIKNEILSKIQDKDTDVEQNSQPSSIDEDIIPASPVQSTAATIVRLLKKNDSVQKKVTDFFK